MRHGKWCILLKLVISAVMLNAVSVFTCLAEDGQTTVQQLEEMVVHGSDINPGISMQPGKTTIELDEFSVIGDTDNVMDVLKTQAVVDFRGENDLDPGVDSIYLRGFESYRFVTALDGVTIQRTGGNGGSNLVDYATLPPFLIDRVEIIPGPHSAMVDAKAIGGAINFVSKAPQTTESLKPDLIVKGGYRTYNTMNSTLSAQGAVSKVSYDLAYRKYRTDGYLRNSASDMDTVYGRLGLVLPQDGFITLGASYSDADRERPVNNPAKDGSDYDPDYPVTSGTSLDPGQNPTWDSLSYNYRLNYQQALPIGRINLGAFYGKANRDRYYTSGTKLVHYDTHWWQQGGKITDTVGWTANHTTTLGFDYALMHDDLIEDEKTKRIDKQGSFLQHQWRIRPWLNLKLGVRYEDLNVWMSGNDQIYERHFAELIPKSFVTWDLGVLAAWLHDTSLSAGVSKIWHAPDAQFIYRGRSRVGKDLEPEHGMGYDLILSRRLWHDVAIKIDYSFYEIKDYFVSATNVDKVHRNGVDVELNGHIIDPLSFYLTYAWQDFKHKGDDKNLFDESYLNATGYPAIDRTYGVGLSFKL
ncbi:TonB-dependent receptor [Desulfosarcina ovata]|uniref:Uncharacterized protein n=1 Tax=Desulfosarcina ovata subsp. ovata TaxID=2752305 RepID=A0A5K8AAI7_9BACT|nr:TonB-dependent receptor [Desulfosarcina ovata]BBO89642.1 hypothetical protein DSCOOX_28220 [Desulfosarcina ovata subsp. ovata]